MEQFIEFIGNHWILSTLFIVLLAAYFLTEQRKSGAAISNHQLTQLTNNEKAVIIDLRERDKFKEGHISGAKNIPEADIDQRITELKKHKDKPIILVCNIGMNAKSVAKKLKLQGFDNIHRLQGGMGNWQADNLPVVSK